MLNRMIVLLLALATLGVSNAAFASRATTLVMGSGDSGAVLNGGSLYYDDAYNIFYNPAYVNDFKNWAIIEKSNYPGTTAQGGFAYSFGNVNFAAFFNRGDAIANTTTFATPGGVQKLSYNYAAYPSSYAPLRPIELFLGTDAGAAKIGLGVTYAANSQPATTTVAGANSTYFLVSIGAEIEGLEPFAAGSFLSKDSVTTANHKFYRIGTRYHFGEYIPYVAFNYIGNPYTAATSPTPGTERNWVAGIARNTKVADSTRLVYALSYVNSTDTGLGNNKRNIVPIDLALEGDALTWLTLRAGVGYHLMDRYGGGVTQSAADNTNGRLGATIHVNKVDFEWAIGRSTTGTENNSVGYAAGSDTRSTAAGTNAPNGPDTQSFDLANGFFTAANLTYHL